MGLRCSVKTNEVHLQREAPAAVRRHPQGKYLDYADIDGCHLFDGKRNQIGGINAGLMLLETSGKGQYLD